MQNELKLDSQTLEIIANQNAAVAVSGGSDSLALLLLLQEQSNADLSVITVNHGLREEALAEAQYVEKFCADRDLSHTTINVQVQKQGNVASNARQERYQAMRIHCEKNGIKYLLLGHTENDQIETFFLNVMRGSGVDGLAAMPKISPDGFLLRPMLKLRREDLQHYLRDHNIRYVSDPSNEDLNRERIRFRRWIEIGKEQGLAFSALETTIENISRARDFLHEETNRAAHRLINFAQMDIEAKIERSQLLACPEEIALRILAKLCQFFGHTAYKPRLSALQDLFRALHEEKGGRVLEKTQFQWQGRFIRVYAEPAHLKTEFTPPHWSRFSIQPHILNSHPKAYIEPIKEEKIRKDLAEQYSISSNAAKGWPAIYNDSKEGNQFISAQAEDFLVNRFFAYYDEKR